MAREIYKLKKIAFKWNIIKTDNKKFKFCTFFDLKNGVTHHNKNFCNVLIKNKINTLITFFTFMSQRNAYYPFYKNYPR